MLGIQLHDIALIAFLAFLEGILSVDNALVLALMTKDLPRQQHRKALTYGLAGAVVFRLAALAIAAKLIRWTWVKYVGGGYLILVAGRHLLRPPGHGPSATKRARSFWATVLRIEVMDIAFAVDSILAAIALTRKLWIVFAGGMIGVVMVRYAATVFLKLLHRFPNFEKSAYLLVLIIGVKLVLEGLALPGIEFRGTEPAHLAFWGLMFLALGYGLRRR